MDIIDSRLLAVDGDDQDALRGALDSIVAELPESVRNAGYVQKMYDAGMCLAAVLMTVEADDLIAEGVTRGHAILLIKAIRSSSAAENRDPLSGLFRDSRDEEFAQLRQKALNAGVSIRDVNKAVDVFDMQEMIQKEQDREYSLSRNWQKARDLILGVKGEVITSSFNPKKKLSPNWQKAKDLVLGVKHRGSEAEAAAGDGDVGEPIDNSSKMNLTVMILRGNKFTNLETFGISDPFARVTVLQSDGSSEQQQTSTVDACLEPRWNESFDFRMEDEEAKNGAKLLLEVFDEDVTTETRMAKTEIPLIDVILQGGAVQKVTLEGEDGAFGGFLYYWAKWEPAINLRDSIELVEVGVGGSGGLRADGTAIEVDEDTNLVLLRSKVHRLVARVNIEIASEHSSSL